jgi:hypothetical protein
MKGTVMFKTVEKLHPTILSAEDVLFLSDSVAPIISRHFDGDAVIAQMLGSVNTGIDLLQTVISRSGSNELTPELKKQDRKRSRALSALRHFVASFMFREDEPQKAAAAKKIYQVLKRTVADVRKSGYSKRTVHFPILIEKLELPENKEALALIGGQPNVDYFKNSNDTFEETYRTRAEKEAEEDKVRKGEAKETALHYLDVLFTNIGYLKENNGGTHDSLVETINEVISVITAVARARKTREHNGKPASGQCEFK